MKMWIIIVLFLTSYMEGYSQRAITDSLWGILKKEKKDTTRAKILYKLSYYYKNNKPDSALLLAQASYTISKKERFEKGEATSLGLMGEAFNRLGNFPKALEYNLEQLKILEKKGDAEDLASAYLSIAMVYNSQQDAGNAIRYAYAADSIATTAKLDLLSPYTLLDIGDIYTNAGQLDSAVFYTERSYHESMKANNNLLIGTALNNLGNIYFKKAFYDKAAHCYHTSLSFLKAEEDYNSIAECYLGLAKTYDRSGMPDSSLAFANEAYRLSTEKHFLQQAMNASFFLTVLYKKENRIDSAFTQQQIYLTLKDSFDNGEKIKALQSLTVAEELRQQQLVEEKKEEEEQRDKRLQLILIAAFIPLLFFITVYITKKRVSQRVIRTTGILSLLLFFEYITILIHPMISITAHHSPILELLFFVAFAAMVLPAHHKIEHWVIAKLTTRHQNYLAALENAAKKATEAE